MANVPDYSQYISVKKVRVAQTANTSTSIVKGRVPYAYSGYFPMYRNVRLPINALLSNKFTQGLGGPPPFSPTDISSNALWLDAADITSVTLSGSNVTQWSDKSGNAYHFTVHPSHTAPTYSSNAVNGLNSLFFQGAGVAGTRYNILYNTSVPVNGPAFSIFVVARRNAIAPSHNSANYILTDNNNSRLLFITFISDQLLTSTNTGSSWNDIATNTPGQTMLATAVAGMVVNGSVLTPYFNGTAQNTKGGTTASFTGLAIGDVLNSVNSGQTWTGFICEILVYNIALNTQQRQQVEGYLAWKWGLQANLPAGHPYKLSKP